MSRFAERLVRERVSLGKAVFGEDSSRRHIAFAEGMRWRSVVFGGEARWKKMRSQESHADSKQYSQMRHAGGMLRSRESRARESGALTFAE